MNIKNQIEECNILSKTKTNATLTIKNFINELEHEINLKEETLEDRDGLKIEIDILRGIKEHFEEVIDTLNDLESKLHYLAIDYRSYIDLLKIIDLYKVRKEGLE